MNALLDSVRRCVAQQTLRLAGICLAMTHIPRPEVAVSGLGGRPYAVQDEVVTQQSKQGVERGAITHGHVIDLIPGLRVGRGSGQQVGLHGIGDKAEVAAGFAVAVDVHHLALQQGGGPFGNDGSIGAVGVLPRAEYVEVAQANGVEVVAAGEYFGVQFIDVLGHCIGAERFADGVFDLGQCRVVAIGGAAGGVGKAFDLGVAGGHQHVEEAGDVGTVGRDGVFKAAGDAAEGGLVQHVVNTVTGLVAVGQVADVALDEVKAGPLSGCDQGPHLIEVALISGGEVVQADHALVEPEQRLKQVAADEAGHPANKPGGRLLGEADLEVLIGRHVCFHSRHRVAPAAMTACGS